MPCVHCWQRDIAAIDNQWQTHDERLAMPLDLPNAEEESLTRHQAYRLGKERREKIALFLLQFFLDDCPEMAQAHFRTIGHYFNINLDKGWFGNVKTLVDQIERSHSSKPELSKEIMLSVALELLRRIV